MISPSPLISPGSGPGMAPIVQRSDWRSRNHLAPPGWPGPPSPSEGPVTSSWTHAFRIGNVPVSSPSFLSFWTSCTRELSCLGSSHLLSCQQQVVAGTVGVAFETLKSFLQTCKRFNTLLVGWRQGRLGQPGAVRSNQMSTFPPRDGSSGSAAQGSRFSKCIRTRQVLPQNKDG